MKQFVKDLIKAKKIRLIELEKEAKEKSYTASLEMKDWAVAMLRKQPERTITVTDKGAATLLEEYGFKVKKLPLLIRLIYNQDGYEVSVPDKE